MVSLMGAHFSKPLIANKVTHLICYKFEGEKYDVAKKVNINLVNHQWLEECLKAWEILPIDDYTKSGWEIEIMEAQGRDSSGGRRISRSTPITEIRMRSHVDSHVDAPIRGPTISPSKAEGAAGGQFGTPEQIRKTENASEKSLDIRADSGSAPNKNGVITSADHGSHESTHPCIYPSKNDEAPADQVSSDEAKDDHKRAPDTRAIALCTPSVHKSIAPAIPADNIENIDGILHNSNQISVNNVLWSNSSEKNCSKKISHSSEMGRKVDQKDDGHIPDLKPTISQSYVEEKVNLCESNLRSEGNSASRNNQILGYSRRRSSKSVSPETNLRSVHQTASAQCFEGNTPRVAPRKNDLDFSETAGAQRLRENEVIKHEDRSSGALSQKRKSILSSVSSKPRNGAPGAGTGTVISPFSSRESASEAATVSNLGRSSTESTKVDGRLNSDPTSNFTEKQMHGSFKSNLLSYRRTSLKLVSSAEVEKIPENYSDDKIMGAVGKVKAPTLQEATTEKGCAICPSVNSEVRKESSGVSLQHGDTEMSDAHQLNKFEVADPNSERDKVVSHQSLEAGPKEIPDNTITDEYGTFPPKVSTSRVKNAGAKRSRTAGSKAATELVNSKSEVAASKTMHDKVSSENVEMKQEGKISSPNVAECPLFPEGKMNSKSRNEVVRSSLGHNSKMNDALAVSKAEFVNVIPQKNMKENHKNLSSSAIADEYQGRSSQKVPNSIARNSVAKGSRTAGVKTADAATVDKAETMSLNSSFNEVGPPENGEACPKKLSSSASADDPETCTANKVPSNRVRKVVAKRKVSAVQKHKSAETCNSASVFVSEDKDVSSKSGAQRSRNAGKVTEDQDLQNASEDKRNDVCGLFCKGAVENRSKKMQSSKSRSIKRQKTTYLVDGSTDHDKENIPAGSDFISKTKNGNNSMSSKSITKASQNGKVLLDERSMIEGNDCGTLNMLEPAWFILSGHRLLRKEYKSILRRLKGRVCRDSHHWSFQATHFIATELRRTEKFFAAAAAGRWILKPDYLTACNEAGKLLEEEPFEWHGDGLNSGDTISLDAPRKWRQLRQRTGHGAFFGMQIIIYGECIAPTLDTLKRTIRSGDGTILATSPPYTRFLNSGVDFAVVSAGMPILDAWVQEFMRHNIPCISADYLVEYVCKPGHPLTKHVLFNMHDQAEKSLQKLLKNQQDGINADTVETAEGGEGDTSCSACGSNNREGLMLVCGGDGNQAGCGVRVHVNCCNLPLGAAPDSKWLCPRCDEQKSTKKAKKSARSRVLKCR
ncbi:BRCT domain-containing protein At4g02110-like isoform X2 [Phragmites australis]|nr:BRCT domain-containing protein At4g02110-like isoform X2 [Phragmites australis]